MLYNRTATYANNPVCVEYYGGYFSGWTFNSIKDAEIFSMEFYPVDSSEKIIDGIVDAGTISFSGDSAAAGRDYNFCLELNTIEPEDAVSVDFIKCGEQDLSWNANGNEYKVSVPGTIVSGEYLDLSWQFRLGEDRIVSGSQSVWINNGAYFEDLIPARDSRTGGERRPVISVHVSSVEQIYAIQMLVNGQEVPAKYDQETGLLSYTPEEELPLGRSTVSVSASRPPDSAYSDRVERINWSFIVGDDASRLYFGQLHSHTGEYSDGVGTLKNALNYIASLPASANIDFLAFTDHSNYFDRTNAANPENALYDSSLMTEESRTKWQTYKSDIAEFNANHSDLIALAGFEMTWSGGPGHINTFNTEGLVSRNNQILNEKDGDAGLRSYYELLGQPEGNLSLSQFNHPGKTYGNFVDFNYRNDLTDSRIFLVEVGNGQGLVGQGGYYPSYEEYTRALDMGWHVAPTNNQDNHKGRWGNANDARDVILTDDFSEEGLYEAIRSLRVYATEDKNLSIFYTVNDKPLGTVFEETPESLRFLVQYYDPDAKDEIKKVELISNGGKTVYSWEDATVLASGRLEAELTPSNSYYYVRVTQKDGELAVTAPIWVEKSINAGISSFSSKTEEPVVG